MTIRPPPLNQSYRMEETREAYPELSRIEAEYETWLREVVRWCPHDTHQSLSEPGKIHIGRAYDCAVTLASIEFRDKTVLELGARASFLSSYLTQWASEVHVTDLFGQSHHDLGSLEDWEALWWRAAFRPERLTCGVADMRSPTLELGRFDVVISLSTVEHLTKPPFADVCAAQNMGRLCRPGGHVVISTDMAETFRKARGYYYDQEAVWGRLILPTGCEPMGAMDLSWERAEKTRHGRDGFERSACIFVLQKPGGEA